MPATPHHHTPPPYAPGGTHEPAEPSSGRRLVRVLTAAVITVAVVLAAVLALPALGADDDPGRPETCTQLPDPSWCDRDPADWPLPDDTTDEERALLACIVGVAACDGVAVPELADVEDPDASIIECLTAIDDCDASGGDHQPPRGECPEAPEPCHEEQPPRECDTEGAPEVTSFATSAEGTKVSARFTVAEGADPIASAVLDWGPQSDTLLAQGPGDFTGEGSFTYQEGVGGRYTIVLTVHDRAGRCSTVTRQQTVSPLYRATVTLNHLYGASCASPNGPFLLGWSLEDRGKHTSSSTAWGSEVMRTGTPMSVVLTFDNVRRDQLDRVGVDLHIDGDGTTGDFQGRLGTSVSPATSDVRFGEADIVAFETNEVVTVREDGCVATVGVQKRLQPLLNA